jgi:hypothetical protein
MEKKMRMSLEENKESNIVFSLFDLSGLLVKPWAKAGYECHIVDLQHPKGVTVEGNVTKWGMDVYEWENMFESTYPEKMKHVVFAAFFPPCTDLAVSGARWFAKKERDNPGTRKRAMDLVHWSDKLGQKLKCPYFIENPVSVISSEWRSPDFTFHPYEYGGYDGGSNDGYTKKTCLWTGNDFILPHKKPIKLDAKTHDRIHKMPPSTERANMRSLTPTGYAQALFEMYSAPFMELK